HLWGDIDGARTRRLSPSTPRLPSLLRLSPIGGRLHDSDCVLCRARILWHPRPDLGNPVGSVFLVPGLVSAVERIDASGLATAGEPCVDRTRCRPVRYANRVCLFILA